jgi:hypothetical protein
MKTFAEHFKGMIMTNEKEDFFIRAEDFGRPKLEVLKDQGFKKVGELTRMPNKWLDGFLNMPPLKNAIYFFAVDNKIPKVGRAKDLQKRFYQYWDMTGKWDVVNYRNGSWRTNEVLNTKFKIGTKIEVYAKNFDISTNSVEVLGKKFQLEVPLHDIEKSIQKFIGKDELLLN